MTFAGLHTLTECVGHGETSWSHSCLMELETDRRILLDAGMIGQCQDLAGLIEMLEKELAGL